MNALYLKFFLSLLLLTSEEKLFSDNKLNKQACLNEEQKQYSEIMGYRIAKDLKEDHAWFDLETFISGVKQYMNVEESHHLTDKNIDDKIEELECKIFDIEAKKNLEEAEDFLQKIRKKEQVVLLEKGNIIYEILKKGCGQKLTFRNQKILIRYTISDIEEKDILQNSTPCSCCLEELLPSLGQAMIGMEPGEIRKIYIHPSLAYGNSGVFPPNYLFIANIEFINFEL